MCLKIEIVEKSKNKPRDGLYLWFLYFFQGRILSFFQLLRLPLRIKKGNQINGFTKLISLEGCQKLDEQIDIVFFKHPI